MKQLKKLISQWINKKNDLYEFCGYIEGNHIMDGNVNVIVTDGFTGNIALKTAEGTAKFYFIRTKKSFIKWFNCKNYHQFCKYF